MLSFLNINSETIDNILEHLLRTVPLAIVCVIGLVFFIKLAFSALKKSLPESLQEKKIPFISRLEYCLILILGFLVALEVIIPESKIAFTLSIAILTFILGLRLFFYDVLRNFIAGLFIRVDQPIQVGSQLIVTPYIGVIESIGTYKFTLKTNDTTTMSFPNSLIFDQHVTLQPPGSLSCEEYEIDIGDADSLEEVQKIIKRATLSVGGVEAEPGVKALVHGLDLKFGYRSVIVRVSWWIDPMKVDIKELRSNVIYSIKLALDESQIGLSPSKYNTLSNHNNISPIK